jgi:hypothetical protein
MRATLRVPRNRRGQGLVEYAFAIALVGVGLTVALVNLRNSIGNTLNTTGNRVAQVAACPYSGTGPECAASDDGSGDGGGDGRGGGGSGDGGGNGNRGGNTGGNGNGNGGGNGNGNGNSGNGSGNGGGNGNGNGRNGNENGSGKNK